jgi:hypothetical protein
MNEGIRQRIAFSSYIHDNVMTKDQIQESHRSIPSRLNQASQDSSPIRQE